MLLITVILKRKKSNVICHNLSAIKLFEVGWCMWKYVVIIVSGNVLLPAQQQAITYIAKESLLAEPYREQSQRYVNQITIFSLQIMNSNMLAVKCSTPGLERSHKNLVNPGNASGPILCSWKPYYIGLEPGMWMKQFTGNITMSRMNPFMKLIKQNYFAICIEYHSSWFFSMGMETTCVET